MPITCKIPFSGLYYSSFSDAINSQLAYIFSDDCGTVPAANVAAYQYALENVDYRAIQGDIARNYAEYFCDEFSIALAGEQVPDCRACLAYSHWNSPRFYNFETDHIYISIDPEACANIAAYISRPDTKARYTCRGEYLTFKEYVNHALAPRDGFIPFYSNNLYDWDDWSTWDSAQWGIALEFAAESLGVTSVNNDEYDVNLSYFNERYDYVYSSVSDAIAALGDIDAKIVNRGIIEFEGVEYPTAAIEYDGKTYTLSASALKSKPIDEDISGYMADDELSRGYSELLTDCIARGLIKEL